jgi:hypothetical protein
MEFMNVWSSIPDAFSRAQVQLDRRTQTGYELNAVREKCGLDIVNLNISLVNGHVAAIS